MSYIFEALQRAEAERSGGSLPKNADSVADLLQGVEQEIERKQSLSELPAAAKPESPGAEFFCLRESALARTGGGFPAGVSDGSGQPGGGKVSRAGFEAAKPARTAQAQTDRGDRHVPGRREESGCGESRAQSVAQQGFEDAADRWRSAAAELSSRFGFDRTLPGLSECFRGERQLAEVVYKIRAPASGSFPPA